MKRLQINHNVLTKEIIAESKRYMVTSFQKYSLLTCTMIGIVVGVYHLIVKDWWMTFAFFAVALICVVELIMMQRKMYKELSSVCQDREKVVFALAFGSDSVTIHNCAENTDEKIPYEHMKEIKETKSSYVIVGKYGELIIVCKDALKHGVNELIEFLQTKKTKIKKWPKIN